MEKIKLKFKPARIRNKMKDSFNEIVIALLDENKNEKGMFAVLNYSRKEPVDRFIGIEFEVLSGECDSRTRIYGARTYCGKVMADNTYDLPKEYQETAKSMLYSN